MPETIGTVVSPADGKLVEIVEVDDPIIGAAVRFGIFLSVFNVHANRIAMPGRVVRVRYRPGKFLNALRSESTKENENMDVELECPEIGGRIVRIRQITGQFARRIVCWARVGDVLQRGEMFGMIKLGSRTELVIPRDEALEIVAQVGEKVCAGSTVSSTPTRQETSFDAGGVANVVDARKRRLRSSCNRDCRQYGIAGLDARVQTVCRRFVDLWRHVV